MIRGRNVSSKEIILNRDQYTLTDLNLDAATLYDQQVSMQLQNHPHSAKSKVKKGVLAKASVVWPGALVFLKKDLSKLKGREEYIVVSLDQEHPDYCYIKKAVKQLRVENYKVKLTEISLIPNQKPPFKNSEINDNVEGSDIDKRPIENTAIDKPPTKNVIDEDVFRPDSTSIETGIKDPRKYDLRRKRRKNYQEMNEGIFNVTYSADSNIEPPKYAWDSFDDDSDDCDEVSPTPIVQFQSCAKLD